MKMISKTGQKALRSRAPRRAKARMMDCSYGKHATLPSDPTAAFFQARGIDSEFGKNGHCGDCGGSRSIHEPEAMAKLVAAGRVHKLWTGEPLGAHAYKQTGMETDSYYCGCYGWD